MGVGRGSVQVEALGCRGKLRSWQKRSKKLCGTVADLVWCEALTERSRRSIVEMGKT
jgi:hypothetical protein